MPAEISSVDTVLATISQLQTVVNGLTTLDRRHYVAETEYRENVAAHSLAVATVALFLHDAVQSTTDLATVLRYAVAHDFLEVYAGDENTFASAEKRTAKAAREEAALERFRTEFADFPLLPKTLEAYEARDAEARFVWTADKIQALIHGQLDHWRAYHEQGITIEEFSAKYAELLAKSSPELQPLFAEIIEACKTTY
ncbi:HD domain-containing protein [Candidatus Berkelbacteria bacterium]|nr:HD domain-containing protein [Candidatus Berkelbacteria bacterium]